MAYFPGCSLKTAAANFEISAIASAKALGIEMIEVPRWNCCGTVYSLANDDMMRHVAPIRVLVRVQEMVKKGIVEDGGLVTLCSMCYNTLRRANLFVKQNPEKLKLINDFMDREEDYKGEVRVQHLLEVLREEGLDKLEQGVKKPLQDLRIAPYYGCTLLRPREVGMDDPDDPSILEKVLEALGAQVVDNPYKARCCGSYHTVNKEHLVVKLAYDIVSYAAKEGADAIALSCPLCAFNLDDRQKEVAELHRDFGKIPVFYFTQLMAVALGLDHKFYGFDLNQVDPRPILRAKNLIGEEVIA